MSGAVGDRGGALGQQCGRHQLEHAVLGAPTANSRRTTGHHRSPGNARSPGSLVETRSEAVSSDEVPPVRFHHGVHLTRIYTRTGDDGSDGTQRFQPGREERSPPDRLRRL